MIHKKLMYFWMKIRVSNVPFGSGEYKMFLWESEEWNQQIPKAKVSRAISVLNIQVRNKSCLIPLARKMKGDN